jgi:hypothetical protein
MGGHGAHTEEMRYAYKIFVRNPEGMNNLIELGFDGRVI